MFSANRKVAIIPYSPPQPHLPHSLELETGFPSVPVCIKKYETGIHVSISRISYRIF